MVKTSNFTKKYTSLLMLGWWNVSLIGIWSQPYLEICMYMWQKIRRNQIPKEWLKVHALLGVLLVHVKASCSFYTFWTWKMGLSKRSPWRLRGITHLCCILHNEVLEVYKLFVQILPGHIQVTKDDVTLFIRKNQIQVPGVYNDSLTLFNQLN